MWRWVHAMDIYMYHAMQYRQSRTDNTGSFLVTYRIWGHYRAFVTLLCGMHNHVHVHVHVMYIDVAQFGAQRPKFGYNDLWTLDHQRSCTIPIRTFSEELNNPARETFHLLTCGRLPLRRPDYKFNWLAFMLCGPSMLRTKLFVGVFPYFRHRWCVLVLAWRVW